MKRLSRLAQMSRVASVSSYQAYSDSRTLKVTIVQSKIAVTYRSRPMNPVNIKVILIYLTHTNVQVLRSSTFSGINYERFGRKLVFEISVIIYLKATILSTV